MTREDANKTLKENLCAMCAYGSQNMDSCDIRSCDNRDAIKALGQEPCEDAVSKKAVLEMIEQIQDAGGFIGCSTYSKAFEIVDNMPPVTPTRKKGKWIKQYTAFVNDDNQIVTECHCNNCYGISYFRSMNGELVGAKYCPNCGAEMESEENDKEESGNNEKK